MRLTSLKSQLLAAAFVAAFTLPLGAQSPSPVMPPLNPASSPSSSPALGQPAPGATKEPDYTVKLNNYGWTTEGNLVLGLNIAAVGKDMDLGGYKGKGKSEALDIFSLGEGYLVDAYTDKKIQPLDKLPRKPFFGTMACINKLYRGDTMVMGVAFPGPPIPPLSPDGKQQPYKFVYHHALLQPVDITFPCENSTSSSPAAPSSAPAPAGAAR
ncbi:MAG: hypothetical protein ACAI35_21190 [Candidatus Methylacidiphilales bacterium]